MMTDMADLDPNAVLATDLCIVGAGAAGITLALQFVNSRTDVLLVESGGWSRQAETQDLYAGRVVSDLHPPADSFRCRQFGGSTTLWTGRCGPFDPIDFERRDYIAHSGWPFGIDELEPYYRKANALCEAGEFAYSAVSAFSETPRPMVAGLESDHFCTNALERFSKPTNFADRYGPALKAAPNVRVVLGGNATRFIFDDTGSRLAQMALSDLGGKNVTVAAKEFVIATGGLEVPRLLLANRDVHPNGVGNTHDAVGRYYMCHLAGTVGKLRFKPSVRVSHDYTIAADGTYCRRHFALRARAQRNARIGNLAARLHHPRIFDPEHGNAALSLVFLAAGLLPWEYRRRQEATRPLTLKEYGRHIANVASQPLSAMAFAYRVATKRLLADRKIPSLVVRSTNNIFSLDFIAEQVPNPESRIVLGTERDALGMPRLVIDWRYTSQDVETIAQSMAFLASDMKRSNVGTFDYDRSEIEREIARSGAYGGHHIGAARMGNDPRTSVVDANCRVHDIANLYIASSATFPTSGPTSPTLTLVALVLRLSEAIAAKLAPVGAATATSMTEDAPERPSGDTPSPEDGLPADVASRA